MNSRLLSVFLLFCTLAFGQIPTNGLQRAYDFSNGSLADDANGANFTQNGTNLVVVNDRFGTPTNSIQLNGDFLNSATFSFTNISIAFWIKTDVIDSSERTIFDKSERTSANFSSANDFKNGFFIYFKDGRIGFKSSRRVVFNNNTQAQGNFLGDRFFSEFVADGTWKHIVITIKKEATQFNTSSGRNTYPYTYKFYVDNTLSQTSVENVQVGGIFTGRDLDRPVDFKIANISNGTLSATQTYQDTIDDIYIYDRVLTASEVTQITTDNNYTVCETPDIADVSITNITENSAILVLPQTDTYDVAYGLTSQPFNTYTIENDVNGNVLATNLDLSSDYTVQYRKKCSGNSTYNPVSGWSASTTFRTKGPLFVNGNATGLNDGSSWANAYTSLQDALININAGEEIWVASGTYKADASNRAVSFTVNADNVKLYGGFAGTETSIYQRDVAANETILSGDLLGNDNNIIDFSEPTRSDNTQHIIRLNAHNTTIDGFTISGGHSMGSSNEASAAIYVTISNPLGFTVNNCTVKNNVADNGAFFTFTSQSAYLNGTRNVEISNTVVENNVSRYGTINFRALNADNTTGTLYNCLFKDNVVKDRPGTAGFAGSVVWAFSNSVPASLTISLNVINCTLVNNQDLGTNASLNNLTRSPIMVGESSSTMETDISNTISWNNTTTGGNTSRAVSSGNAAATGTILISNSISNDDFANIAATNKENTSNADPLFTSATDFTLQATSPAIDFGVNSKLPTPLNVDLVGNSRIFNVTVDMGAYEFGATTFRPILNILATNGSVTTNPNPTNGSYDFGENVFLTPVADPGFEFTGWSGDLSGSATTEQILMDSNKAVTATFSPIQRTLTINSSGGTITTNPNPVNGTFDNGTVVTITANPNTGFMFDGWSGDASGNNNPLTITMDADKVITANFSKNRVFVDANASGANDGTSWANAYTSLKDALDNNPISDFWIKAGTYLPGSNRTDIFTLTADQSLYGGFSGTETMLSQRDPSTNSTILSGDILGNDDGNLVFGNNTYSDNVYRILQITQNNVIIDGVTISGGNANGGNNSLKSGAAMRIIESCRSVTINDVLFTNNRVERGGVVYYAHTSAQSGNYDYTFTNCTFTNNLGRFASLVYGENPRTNGTLTSTFINCAFYENVVADLSGSDAGTNALFWFRTDLATTQEAIFINSTIANNSLSATSTTTAGVVSISRNSGTANLEMYNTIVWDNTLTNGNEQVSVNRFGTQTAPNSVTIANSLAPDGFSNWTAISNIQTTDPMFSDPSTGLYTLMAGSPAIDTGDSSLLPSSFTVDRNGNNRIVGGTIDMGAFEFDPTLSTVEIVVNSLDFTIYPNPTKTILHIQATENIETVTIFDMTGKQILRTNNKVIDVRMLQSGMYMLRVTSNQRSSIKRFLKQ